MSNRRRVFVLALLGMLGGSVGLSPGAWAAPDVFADEVENPLRHDIQDFYETLGEGTGIAPAWGTTQTVFCLAGHAEPSSDSARVVFWEILLDGEVFAVGLGDSFIYYTRLPEGTGQLITFRFTEASDADPPQLSDTELDVGTVDVFLSNQIYLRPVDENGDTHMSHDTSGGRLHNLYKGGLVIEPVDPANDDEGTTSSIYTFRVEYQNEDGLPPKPYLDDVDWWDGPGGSEGDYVHNEGVVLYIDGRPHFMAVDRDLSPNAPNPWDNPLSPWTDPAWANGVVFKYTLRPSNGTDLPAPGQQFDNDYFTIGPGYHTYWFATTCDVITYGDGANSRPKATDVENTDFVNHDVITDNWDGDAQQDYRYLLSYIHSGASFTDPVRITTPPEGTPIHPVDFFGNPLDLASKRAVYHPNDPPDSRWPPNVFAFFVGPGLRWGGVTDSGTPNTDPTPPTDDDTEVRISPYVHDWNPLDGGGTIGDGSLIRMPYEPDIRRIPPDNQGWVRNETFHSRARGTEETVWTFWVNYVSAKKDYGNEQFQWQGPDQGEAPFRVRVFIFDEAGNPISGSPFLMVRAPGGGSTAQRSPNDGDYNDNLHPEWDPTQWDFYNQDFGEWYSYTLKLPAGNYRYMFDADNRIRQVIFPRRPGQPHAIAPMTANADLRVNRSSTLSESSVTPTSGPFGREFLFRVIYTDEDNDQPRDAHVHIFTVPERPLSSGDAIAAAGTTTLTDSSLPPGYWKSDYLIGGYLEVFDSNHAPFFNPLEDSHTDPRKVDIWRITGNTGNSITVSPIDLDNDGIREAPLPAGIAYYRVRFRGTMEPTTDSSVADVYRDGDFRNGEVYEYVFNQFPNPSDYAYYFRFIDNWSDNGSGDEEDRKDARIFPEPGVFVSLPIGDAEGIPSTFVKGPIVIEDNAPVLFVSLDDVRDPDDPNELGADGDISDDDRWIDTVTWPGQPANPTPSTLITYRVVYYDKDNNPPAYVRAIIDGIEYDMEKLDPNDNTYSDGVVYQYQTKLSVRPGNPPSAHAVRYYASDGVRGNLYPDPNDAIDGDGELFEPELNTALAFTFTVPPGQPETYTPQADTPVVVPNNVPILVTNTDSTPLTVTVDPGDDHKLIIAENRFAQNSLVGFEVWTNPFLGTVIANDGNEITLDTAVADPGGPFDIFLKDPGTDSLNPDQGGSTTVFAYQVRYFDANNQPPDSTTGGFMRVFIGGVAFDMAKVSASDNEYRDGVLYSYSTALPSGKHKYHFEGSDGDASVRLPVDPNVEFPGPTVNDPPRLANESLSPPTGGQLTNYTYSVNYSDVDNDAPDANMPELWIDAWEGRVTGMAGAPPVTSFNHNVTGIEAGELVGLNLKFLSGNEAGQLFTITDNEPKGITLDAPANIAVNDRFEVGRLRIMEKVDPSDNNFVDGADFFKLTTDVFSVGEHTYHFEVVSAGSSDRHPDTGEFTGPLVDANIAPTLTDGAVTPTQGTTATKFRWTVTYTDADNDDPGEIGADGRPRGHVRVRVKDEFEEEIVGSPFLMKQENPEDRNFVDGTVFFFESTNIPEGPHTFYFEATDGLISVTTPEQNGPDVNYKPQLLSPAITPSGRGTADIEWTWSVVFQDLDGDMPQLAGSPTGVQVVINGTAVDMTPDPNTTDPTTGLTFTYTQQMQEGKHDFFVRSSDGKENVRNPDFTSIEGVATQVQGDVLTDDAAGYTPGQFIGMILRWLDGPEEGVQYEIVDNTETTITVARDFQGAVAGNSYEVRGVYFGPAVNWPPQLEEGTVTTHVQGVVGAVAGDIVTVTEETGNYPPGLDFTGRMLEWTSGTLAGTQHLIEGNTTTSLDLDTDVEGAGVVSGDTFRILDVDLTAGINRSTNTYKYRVKFTDLDSDLPLRIEVFISKLTPPIDEIIAPLIEEDPSDTNTKDGKYYFYEADPAQGTGLLPGSYHFYFEAEDELQMGRFEPPLDPAGPQVNNPPVLKNVGVNPKSGASEENFTYTGIYADADDVGSIAAEPVVLFIDRGISGEERVRVLTPTPPGAPGENWRTGRPFSQVETGLTSGRRHSYFILANDGIESVSVGPILEPLVNSLPVLTVVGKGVDPEEGAFKDEYTFQVDFYDPDGFDPKNPPEGNPQGFVQIVLDNGVPQDLVDTGTGDFGIPPGRRYELVLSGATLGAGEHHFYFQASDGFDMDGDGDADVVLGDADPSNDPTIDPFIGPTVRAQPRLINGTVSPNPGATGDEYTYEITYQDDDGDLPADPPMLHIRGPQDQDIPMAWRDAPSPGDQPSAAEIQAGVVYEARVSGLPSGSYTFSVTVEDAFGDTAESDAIPGPPADPYEGPRVNSKPVLSNGRVTPPRGGSRQTYRWEVTYQDPDGDAPAAGEPLVEITGADTLTEVLQKVDPNADDFAGAGVTYFYEGQLSSGDHAWTFRASDGVEPADPLTGNGPQVNFPPELPAATVTPLAGLSTDTYRYDVEVHDGDGTEPTSLTLTIEDLDDANPPQVTRTRVVDLLTDPQVTDNGAPFDGPDGAGRTYTYTLSAEELGGGAHRFQVQVVNGAGETEETPWVDGPQVNRKPVLSNGRVEPSSGASTATYTYRVQYQDGDGTEPASISVHIGGSDDLTRNLTLDPASGTDFRQGVEYFLALAPLSGGPHTFEFNANDGQEAADAIAGNEPTVNFPPDLSNGAVTPESGPQDGEFLFTVNFRDRDNVDPVAQGGWVKLYLDRDTADEQVVDMTAVSSNGPVDFSETVIYQATVQGLKPSVEVAHTFQFEVNDGIETVTTPLATNRPQVNAPPTFTDLKVVWFDAQGNERPGDDPQNPAPADQEFTFSGLYQDPDGTPPRFVKLFIDDPTESGEGIQMINAEPEPDYQAGALFTANYTFTTGGSHTFHVRVDDRTESTRTEEQDGPFLDQGIQLTAGKVDPQHGKERDEYSFSVQFSDQEGNAPSDGVKLLLDLAGTTVEKTMTSEVADPTPEDYQAGVTFHYQTAAGELPPGEHLFRFRASDGVNPPTETAPQTVQVNHAPTVAGPSVSPDKGSEETIFLWTATITDQDGEIPTVELTIDGGDPVSMEPAAGSSSDITQGVVYEHQQSLAAGSHRYQIRVHDGLDEATTDEIDGPIVGRAPQLTDGEVTPLAGTESTEFIFRVTYQDEDNDEPEFIQVVIDGVAFLMQPVDPNDLNYQNGKRYEYRTKLASGSRKFYFKASDGVTTVDTPEVEGPVVTPAPLLVPGTGSVTPGSGDTNTRYRYQVTFLHPENQAPTSIQVVIDGQARPMEKLDPQDLDYTDGVRYFYDADPDAVPPSGLAAGNHAFHFEAQADGLSLREPERGERAGPVVAQGATLILNLPASLNLGENLQLAGQLVQQPGAEIGVKLVDPEGVSSEFTLTADGQGRFTHNLVPSKSGTWQVTVSWAGNAQFGAVERTRSLEIRPATLTLPSGIHFLSIPVVPRDARPEAVFAGAGEVKITRWQPAANQYLPPIIRQEAADLFGPGIGIWVQLLGSGPITATADGTAADPTQPLEIPVQRGWNMIGNGFLKTVDWAAAQVRFQGQTVDLSQAQRNGWVSSYAWFYRADTGYQLVHGSAANAVRGVGPWEGLWLRAFVDCALILNPVEFQGTSTPTRARSLTVEGAWSAPLVVMAGGRSDTYNYFGAGATQEGPLHRLETPPLPAETVDLSFVNVPSEGQRLPGYRATDIRVGQPPRLEWEVEVRTDLAHEDVTLMWPDLSGVPEEYRLTLEDLETGEVVFLRTRSHFRFNSGEGGVRRLRLIAERGVNGTLHPTAFRVNPPTMGRGVGSVTFNLPRGAVVDVELLSLSQKVLRSVARGRSAAAGLNELPWDGRDEQGRPLPNGTYLARLTVVGPDGEQVQEVTSFTLLR